MDPRSEGELFDASEGDVVVILRGVAYTITGSLTYLVLNQPGFREGDDEYDD